MQRIAAAAGLCGAGTTMGVAAGWLLGAGAGPGGVRPLPFATPARVAAAEPDDDGPQQLRLVGKFVRPPAPHSCNPCLRVLR